MAIRVHGPRDARARSILKLNSLVELSIHKRVIWDEELTVAVRFDGAEGGVIGGPCVVADTLADWADTLGGVAASYAATV